MTSYWSIEAESIPRDGDIVGSRRKLCSGAKSTGVTSEYTELLDEAQIEVTNDLISFYDFYTKEEAILYKQQNPATTDIHEHDSLYRVGYSVVGDLALQAVAEAGQYYKLNVPLTAEYAVGACWRDCH